MVVQSCKTTTNSNIIAYYTSQLNHGGVNTLFTQVKAVKYVLTEKFAKTLWKVSLANKG